MRSGANGNGGSRAALTRRLESSVSENGRGRELCQEGRLGKSCLGKRRDGLLYVQPNAHNQVRRGKPQPPHVLEAMRAARRRDATAAY